MEAGSSLQEPEAVILLPGQNAMLLPLNGLHLAHKRDHRQTLRWLLARESPGKVAKV